MKALGTMRLNRHQLFTVLCGLFVTALVVADIIGSKLFVLGPVTLVLPFGGGVPVTVPPLLMTAGIVPFPLTFLLTDLINEFYGRRGARFVTLLGLGMAVFTFVLLTIARMLPASPDSPVPGEVFNLVFGLSSRMFAASLAAYLLAQLLDIQVFHFFRRLTREKLLWLRATGSTMVSQTVDSFAFVFLSFAGQLAFGQLMQVSLANYGVKFLVALALTPLCYLGHAVIVRLLGPEAEPEPQDRLVQAANREPISPAQTKPVFSAAMSAGPEPAGQKDHITLL